MAWGERVVYWMIIAGLLLLLSLYRFASRPVAVTVSGVPVAWVPDQASARTAIETARKRLSERQGLPVVFWEKVDIQSLRPPEGETTVSPLEASERILQKVTPAVRAWVIRINGNNTVALPTESDAYQTLQWVQRKVVPEKELMEQPTFKETVEVVAARIPLDKLTRQPEAAAERLIAGEESPAYHIVQKGEVAIRIAKRYQLSLSQLEALNPGRNLHKLQIGDRLIVKKGKPFLTVVSKHLITETVPVPYAEERRVVPTMPAGRITIGQKGRPGLKEVRYEVTYENGREVSRKVVAETVVQAPVAQVILVGGGSR
ncbi:MAG: G5 domain-containing protein [Armatimonadetes bacterium]|nr:G5 domain-containing protein [Armatimonadota bacterium]